MTIRNPSARKSFVWGIEALGELDEYDIAQRIVVYDNATAALTILELVEDVQSLVGNILLGDHEVYAVEGVGASMTCLHDLLGGTATNEQVVNHPHLPAIVCAARYASSVLRREDIE